MKLLSFKLTQLVSCFNSAKDPFSKKFLLKERLGINKKLPYYGKRVCKNNMSSDLISTTVHRGNKTSAF